MTTLPDVTQTLLAAKKAKNLSFTDLEPVVGLDEVCIAAIIYRQATATPDEAQKLTEALGLGPEVARELTEYNVKGLGPVVPTDPFVYRFYEIMQVYGLPLKAVVQEKFGDGIMSAIDFAVGGRWAIWPVGEARGSKMLAAETIKVIALD